MYVCLFVLERSMVIKGGYTGYYNGNLLRSSYEYIFAKYLEAINKKYKVEYETYDLGDYTYTPDFFIFDNNSELEEIVEIRGHRLNIEERIIDTNKLRDITNAKVTLLTELDLKQLCKQNGLKYNKLKNEWRNSPNNILNNNDGKNNPMYGKHHSLKTKLILSKKGKIRMENDSYKRKVTANLIKYCQETDYADAKKPRSKRVALQCKNCGEEFIVTEAQANKQYCSIECMANSKENISNLKKMTEQKMKLKEEKYRNIREYVIQWTNNNKELIENIKLNRIANALDVLVKEINYKYNVKDYRVIAEAVCGLQSRKALVKYLKENIK